jgi:hypothetical protein
VFIGKVALMDPAAMLMFSGSVATAALPLVSVMSAPPVGAGELRVTVPIDGVLPTKEAGVRVTDATVRGVTVNVADCALLL